MPQMMPLNWLFLFGFFSIIFIMFNMMNYFSYFKKYTFKKMMNKNPMNKSLNWKW